MARKHEQGLIYRPQYVEKSTVEKLIRYECTSLRMAILNDLTLRIHKYNGYYIDWNENEKRIFAMEELYETNDIDMIVNSALKNGYFDTYLYEKYHILTSAEIQEVYAFASERKSRIEFIFEYLLLNSDDTNDSVKKRLVIKKLNGELIELSNIAYDPVSNSNKICNNSINADLIAIKSAQMTQIKEKENKKEIKLNSPLRERNKTKEQNVENSHTLKEKALPCNNNADNEKAPSDSPSARPHPVKREYGSYKNVYLSDEEYKRFKAEYADYEKKIEHLSYEIRAKGRKYADHYAILCQWAREDKEKQGNSAKSASPCSDPLKMSDEEYLLYSQKCMDEMMLEMTG